MVLNNDDFTSFLESIRLAYGYDFTNYAEASVKRRVLQFMSKHHINSLGKLSATVLKNEEFFQEFIQEVSVTVTEMFRDPTFFRAVREKVVKRLATYPVIKIWIAGCATGEEVYSLAILLKEEGLLNRCIIYATDINQHSLQVAKDGIYPLRNMKAYTTNYIKSGGAKSFSEYYQAKFEAAMMDKSLRENIVFASHNLTIDSSFNEFQLITCRNVLIYFNKELQNQVINLFYNSLCTFGFLGLGSKESLLFSDKMKLFEEIDKREKVYMKLK